MKKIAILGSTGSIGKQALEVVRAMPGSFKVAALTGHSNLSELKRQASEFRPSCVAVNDEHSALDLRVWCKENSLKIDIVSGIEGIIHAATLPDVDLVLSSVVGAVGLRPLSAAIKARKTIALANKEALVVAGSIIMKLAAEYGVNILPVDSEHSAIFQCLKGENVKQVNRIFLTASGGPFYRCEDLSRITVAQALAHPTWKMGKKITIDSATLMNKGLEAIEAHHLFAVPIEKIEIVIHPQSIVHSMVEYIDGSTIAQLSNPDMKLPIQYALTWPDRAAAPGIKLLDFSKTTQLNFDTPDFNKFSCLRLALEAARIGGTMPAVMNAANEAAVELFLKEKIQFTDIAKIVEEAMSAHHSIQAPGIEDIIEVDAATRARVHEHWRTK